MLLVCDISNLKKKQHRETRVEKQICPTSRNNVSVLSIENRIYDLLRIYAQ